ncbi:MAG: hypothetical protein JSS35_18170 [Proteobacteria bacterium]|nr:hypothetical protein [Pseudomonadota bacterium]
MSQPPEDQLKALWQGQEPENPAMTVQAVRMLVKDNAARQRRYRILGYGMAAVATGIWVWCAWTAPTALVRIGDLVMLGWTPVMLWMLYRRRPGHEPGAEASAQGLLEFYRAEIQRQAPDLRLIALSMAPLALGVVLIGSEVIKKLLQKPGLWIDVLPLAILMVLWIGVFPFQLRRQRRRVAERLRDIDAMRG